MIVLCIEHISLFTPESITKSHFTLRSSWWQQDRHWWDPAVLWWPDPGPGQYKCSPHSLEVQGSNTVRVLKAGVHGWHGSTGVRKYFQAIQIILKPLMWEKDDGLKRATVPCRLLCFRCWLRVAEKICHNRTVLHKYHFNRVSKIQRHHNLCINLAMLTVWSYLDWFLEYWLKWYILYMYIC